MTETNSTVALAPEATQRREGSSGQETEPRRDRTHPWLSRHLEAYALPLLTVAVAAFFCVWSETSAIFPTAANLQIMFGSQTVIAVVALGALIPLIAGEWDLSVGATAGLAAVLVAQRMSDGAGIASALAVGIGAGALVGALNAAIITRARVNAVITTLGMATLLAGVINQRTGGLAVVSNIPPAVTDFGTGTWLGVPRTVFAMAAIALLVYYVFDHTPYGRYLYALGSNAAAAALVGIRVRLVLAASFVLAGLLAAAGGCLQVARAGGADPNIGAGLVLPALAAAFLSAASIRPGRYNVGGTLVALIFLAVVNSGLNLAGAPPYVGSYVNGAALIVGVALAAWLGRRRTA